jgi:glycosyltransferase involved in cell wall biosynthesis
MPKVSIIIPTHNCASYICEAIDSVFSQSYQDFEIIVVDDESVDNTKNILSRYNGKIRYFYKENKGPSAARNLGIREASGKYIALLDADDLWFSSHLESKLNILEQNSGIGLAYGKLQVLENNIVTGFKPSMPAFVIKDFWDGASVTTSSVVVRRECFAKAGLFDERLKAVEDIDMWIRIMKAGFKVEYVPEISGTYRVINPNSLTKNLIGFHQNYVYFHKKHLGNLNKEVPLKLIKKRLAMEYYFLSKEYLRKEDYSTAVKNISKAILTQPYFGNAFVNKEKHSRFGFLKIVKPYLALGYSLLKCLITPRKIHDQKDKVRVLYFEPSSGLGGSGNALFNLVTNIDKKKVEPMIVTIEDGPQFEKIRSLGFRIERIKTSLSGDSEKADDGYIAFIAHFIFSIVPTSFKLASIIRKNNIDMVHINTNIISGIPAILAAKITKRSCICHIRQTRPLIKREKFFAGLVNCFIVLTEYVKTMLAKDVMASKISVIRDGVDPERYQITNRDSRTVGVVSRLVEGKGLEDFIKAGSIITKQESNIRFVIVGSDPSSDKAIEKRLRNLVSNLGLDARIAFKGWSNDITNTLLTINILVQPYTSPEGLPNIIIEAMAAGVPTISTKITGPDEVVVDGTTGFLVPPNDSQALADAIIKLIDNPELAKQMGEAGRRRAEELFDIRKNVKQIEAVYEELLVKQA